MSERIQALTEALAAARTQQDVFTLVLMPAIHALEAIAGTILLVDSTTTRLELATTQRYDHSPPLPWRDGPLDGNAPASDALTRQAPLFFEHPGALAQAYPEFETPTEGVAAAATAVTPMFLDGRPLGAIILDFQEPHTFSEDEQRFLRILAAQCAIALGRARLMANLQQQVDERARQLQIDARAQEAFVAFTEAVGTQLDVSALARQAIAVLGNRFPDGNFSYFEYDPRSAQWRAQVWSDNHSGAQVAMITAGFPSGTPMFADVLRTREAVFRDGWDAHGEQIGHTEEFGIGATYPLVVNGDVQGVLGMAVRNQPRWEERDRALVRAVGRSLNLALERAEQARQLHARSTELEARTVALERFAELTRNQESDVATLIREAQQTVTALIGEGFAVYYELDGDVWRLRSQVGSPDDETIQASLESALPYKTVLNFRRPWERGEPFYQDAYDPALDQGVPGTEALASTAALPLWVGTRRQGMFGYGLTTSRPWSRADRATLETAVGSLGRALERAEQTRALEEERAALDAFVAFTEAAGTESDVPAVVQEALTVLSLRFPGCTSGYYELDGHRWKLRIHTEDLHDHPALRQTLQEGLPQDTPTFAQVLATGAPVFVDHWDAERGQIEHTEAYGMVANYPLILAAEVRAVLSLGFKSQDQWAERDRAVFLAVGRSLNLALEHAERTRELQARQAEELRRSQALTAFAELSRDLGLETDPYALIRRTQDIVLTLLPAGFSAYFEPRDGLWRIGSQVGHANTPELQAVLDAGLPFEAALNLVTPWRSGEPYYQDEYDPDLDQLSGSDEYPGASMTMPIAVNGKTRGILGFALYKVRYWSGEDRAVLETVGRQLALALERAEQTQRLEEEREALDAFVAFSEVTSTETDEIQLAGRAVDVLRVRFTDCSGGYYQRAGERWQLQTWTSDLDQQAEFLAALHAGLPDSTPFIAEMLATHAPIFTEDWNANRERIENSGAYGTVAAYPVMGGSELRGFFAIGLKTSTHWTERDRAIFRSVGRGLDLALERAERGAQQARQTAELDARTRALEGFAALTRDLSLEADPYVLVRRAQEVALSLLPEGYALYFERERDRWVLRVQTGEVRSAALQAAADHGFPYHEARNLLIPYTTLAPYYQERYDQDTDRIGDLGAHLGATATFPVLTQGRPQGVMAVVLFGGRRVWARADQAALESVVHSLGLALERAEGLSQLEARTRQVTEWRERYEVAIQGSGHLLYDWNPVTDEILYGGAVEQMTGYTVQDLDGALSDWTMRLIHPDDRDAFRQEIERVVASGDDFHQPFRLVRKDGTVADVEDDGYFKRDGTGQVSRMVGFIRDVTERNRVQAALVQLNEDLRRSNTELEQFAYVASHDLQAPIRAVISFAGMLARQSGSELDERGQRYLRIISESGEHMKQLVDDLLLYSRVATEQRPAAPTDSHVIFRQVRQRLTPAIEALGAEVTADALPVVLVDRSQLDQLLQNLIGNALKYQRAGVPPRVHVSAQRVGTGWQFAVADNGLGIEPQYFEKIFVIFQRLHGRGAYEGTGIGLAVCKKIVERHGGQVWVTSSPGQGSTFLFTLPGA